jgi:hypothetical protein
MEYTHYLIKPLTPCGGGFAAMHSQLTRTFVNLLLKPQKTPAEAWIPCPNTGKIDNYCVYIHLL